MTNRIQPAFLFLVLMQSFHSAEEYIGELWEHYPPAKYLCKLISDDPERGFVVLDSALIAFGGACWLYCFRSKQLHAQGLIWWWVIMEMINTAGHIIWTITEAGYTPGVATAPVILILAIYIFKQLLSYNKNNRL